MRPPYEILTQLTHRGLAKLARHYGGVFHLMMGLVHVIVVSSPEEAREVLQHQDIIFSNRPASIAISYLTYNRADLVFSNYGPFWRKMRKLCVVHLFSRKRAESWQSVRDEVSNLLRAISGRANSPINIGELVFNLATNITYRAAFGSKVFKQQDEFLTILQEFSKLFGAFNIADYIPFLKGVDPSRLNDRLIKARFALDGFVDQIIDDHINNKKDVDDEIGNNAKGDKVEEDMVDDLLNFYCDKPKITDLGALQNAIKLTRDNIKGIIMDIMFGGTETIALIIEWLMTELLRHPENMKRVQQELADIVGLTRQVKESDLDKLPFLQCCIKETLRMHPPITLLLHETVEDTVINGYYIPKQSRVIINTWAIGRDPNSWYDPEMFKPTRFFEEGVPDFKGGDFEFIPFGSGRRSCPGMVLALYTLELCVANLFHCFTWKLPDGLKPDQVSVEESFGLTTPRASRLIAVPSPRLLCPIN